MAENIKISIDTKAPTVRVGTDLNVTTTKVSSTTPNISFAATGVKGTKGEQGIAGPQGEAGAQGPIGLTGSTGATGSQGSAGVDGSDAVDWVVDQGSTDIHPGNYTDTIYTHPANHAISVITGLQTALDGKVDDSQVLTNVPSGAVFTDTQLPLLDEDDMSSDSESSAPSQQSVKAYVDGKTHLELGTSSSTALAGDTTVISSGQASAITANTAKVDLTVDGAGTVHGNNYTNTTYSVGDGELTQKNFTSVLKTKLDGIASSATAYADADAVSAVSTADDYLKNDAADTIAGDLTVDSAFLYIKDQSGSGAASRLTTATLTGNQTLTLPDDSGTLALTKVHHHFIHAGFFLSYPYSRYIPLNGSLNEQTTSTSAPEYTTFVWPYDGYVKTIWVRSETDMGDTEMKLYKGADGSTVGTAMGAVSLTCSANTSVEFDFTSVTNSFSQGEAMAVRIDPTDDPDGGQNITIECVFDLTT